MKNKALTIKSKVLLVAILPALCLAALLSFYFILDRSRDVDQTLHKEVNDFAKYIAKISEFNLLTGNFADLNKDIQHALQQRAIISIKITDKNNITVAKIVNHKFKPASPNNSPPEKMFRIVQPISTTQLNINDYEQTPNFSSNNNPKVQRNIGKVIIEATTIYASKLKHELVIEALIITGIAISLTILFAILLSRNVSIPLTLLAQGIHKIKHGDLQHRITEQSSGEIGALERNINEMAASLSKAQEFERRQAANLLQSERIKAHTTLESIGEGVITTNENGIVTYINPAAVHLTGYSYEESIGHPLGDIFQSYTESTQEKIDYPIESCLKHGHIVRHDALLKVLRKDGVEFIVRDTATPVRDYNGNVVGAVVVFDDFSTLHAMAEKLVYQAAHDDLTGIYNRREFESQIDLALNESKQSQSDNTVLFIDLDQFKVVNDTCGHLGGDQLLKQISQLLKSKIRDHDILARLGGDEFGIILRNCHPDKAVELAKAIIDLLEHFVFYWGSQQFNIGACIGLTELNDKFINTSDVLMAADSACYLAKDAGRNTLHIYQPSDKEQQKRRSEVKWVQRLKTALGNKDFVLFAQKIHPLSQQSDHDSYEILLRLKLDNKLYTPATFLTVAERYNLMPDIDKWVIDEMFTSINNHFINNAANRRPCRFCINLSGQSLTRVDFQHFVYDKVTSCNIDHSLITFEITETATIANIADAIEFMKTLKQMGCLFALDDFGSGLSSFGYLTSLPLDYIKIDGKIVRDIVTNPINLSIVESITQIAHNMELKIIAEYVESEAILKLLKKRNIDFAQGFHLDKPISLESIFSKSTDKLN